MKLSISPDLRCVCVCVGEAVRGKEGPRTHSTI